MEVDASTFPLHLLGLLINISEADFVSFDFELSGIPSRLPNKQPRPGGGRFTLEERYAETKEGASRYQILQVGMTCARFDYLENNYVLRPYNIYISPLLEERLDIEREITFQAGAVSFLLNHGFDMSKPFTQGVQYLSREEAVYAKQKAWDRLNNKNPPADMQLTEDNVESLDFMRRVRTAISKWKRSASSSLDVTTHTGLPDQPPFPAISRFEKRLVHQLVRAEFPDLVSIGRSECVKIVHHDPVREEDNTRRIKNRIREQITRQTGFRWVFEALTRGEIGRIDPLRLARDSGAVFAGDLDDLRARCDRALERLKTRQPVLVGHNMFTDIVYMYRTFVGELPDTLQGFQDAIHELFPQIIDTKYLATHTEGDLNASPTLQEIAQGLSEQALPKIVTHPDHTKYQEIEAFHEAGYDSLLTATIMIRLAAKLNAGRADQTVSDVTRSTPLEVSLVTGKSVAGAQDFVRDGREKVNAPVPLPPVEPPGIEKSGKGRKKEKRAKKKSQESKEVNGQRFQTKNIFDSLRNMSLNPEDEADFSAPEEDPFLTFEQAEASTAGPTEQHAPVNSWEDDVFVQEKAGWVPVEQATRDPMELIPPFNSNFWKDFGNTLRVFGTQESVLKIAGWCD